MEAILAEKGARPGEAPAVAGAAVAGKCSQLEERASYQFMTLRGKEPLSLCIAARTNMCRAMELVYWNRLHDGRYRTNMGLRDAYTRVMVAQMSFWDPVAWIGTEHSVCVVHLHRMTAKRQKGGGFPEAFDLFWPLLAGVLRRQGCSLLFGD